MQVGEEEEETKTALFLDAGFRNSWCKIPGNRNTQREELLLVFNSWSEAAAQASSYVVPKPGVVYETLQFI